VLGQSGTAHDDSITVVLHGGIAAIDHSESAGQSHHHVIRIALKRSGSSWMGNRVLRLLNFGAGALLIAVAWNTEHARSSQIVCKWHEAAILSGT